MEGEKRALTLEMHRWVAPEVVKGEMCEASDESLSFAI